MYMCGVCVYVWCVCVVVWGGVGGCECGANGTCVIWYVYVACGVYMCGVYVTGMGVACVWCGCR